MTFIVSCSPSRTQSLRKVSEAMLDDVIRRSGDQKLTDHASALLLSQLGATRHYIEAFELANHIAARLPHVTDAKARRLMLSTLSQVMGFAGLGNLIGGAIIGIAYWVAGGSPKAAVAAPEGVAASQ